VVFLVKSLSFFLLMAFFFFFIFISLRPLRATMTVVCVVNCKSLQVATYRHVSTLKRIWTMKNDSKAVHGEDDADDDGGKSDERPSIKLNVVKIKAHNRKTISLLKESI
jgi:hypothetical protein